MPDQINVYCWKFLFKQHCYESILTDLSQWACFDIDSCGYTFTVYRGILGRCQICKKKDEDMKHVFVSCEVAGQISLNCKDIKEKAIEVVSNATLLILWRYQNDVVHAIGKLKKSILEKEGRDLLPSSSPFDGFKSNPPKLPIEHHSEVESERRNGRGLSTTGRDRREGGRGLRGRHNYHRRGSNLRESALQTAGIGSPELTGDSHGSPSCRLSAVVFTLCLAETNQCRYPAPFPFFRRWSIKLREMRPTTALAAKAASCQPLSSPLPRRSTLVSVFRFHFRFPIK
ncbi:hypothetical protein LXL04_014890 [Taraxacum kok-saghyz]